MSIIAYIDGQNLHMGTTGDGWSVDYKRLRVYLKEKYGVDEAHYFLGFVSDDESDLYNTLQRAGFIVNFREHTSHMKGKKKGNVDVDIVFEVMKRLEEDCELEGVVLVSGDGDYIKMVKHLIGKGKLKKILFPNKKYSSLYRKLQPKYGVTLSMPDIKKKLIYKKRDALRD